MNSYNNLRGRAKVARLAHNQESVSANKWIKTRPRSHLIMKANFETGLKVCSKKDCEFKGQPQTIENFHKNKSKIDGLNPNCGNCRSKYSKEIWYPKNKQIQIKRAIKTKFNRVHNLGKEINKIKLNRGCFDCGYNKHSIALDFDHIGDKKLAISAMVSRGWALESILQEINKCEVRCANCHRIKTWERKHNATIS